MGKRKGKIPKSLPERLLVCKTAEGRNEWRARLRIEWTEEWGVQKFFLLFFFLAVKGCEGGEKKEIYRECNLLAIVENGLSDFDCETRGAIEAVIRGISWRTCIRLERDVGSDSGRRAG